MIPPKLPPPHCACCVARHAKAPGLPEGAMNMGRFSGPRGGAVWTSPWEVTRRKKRAQRTEWRKNRGRDREKGMECRRRTGGRKREMITRKMSLLVALESGIGVINEIASITLSRHAHCAIRDEVKLVRPLPRTAKLVGHPILPSPWSRQFQYGGRISEQAKVEVDNASSPFRPPKKLAGCSRLRNRTLSRFWTQALHPIWSVLIS